MRGSTALRREVAGISLLLAAVFVSGALVSRGGSSDLPCTAQGGPFGPLGACTRQALVATVGYAAAALFPVAMIVHALRLLGRLRARADRSWLVFCIGAVPLLAGTIALGVGGGDVPDTSRLGSGLVGDLFAHLLVGVGGVLGAWLIVALLWSVLAAATLRWNPVRMVVGQVANVSSPEALAEPRQRTPVTPLSVQLEPPPEELPAIESPAALQSGEKRGRTRPLPLPLNSAVALGGATPRRERRAGTDESVAREERIAGEIAESERASAGEELSTDLPPVDMLAQAPARHAEQGRKELDAAGTRLMDALRTFRVDGELVGRTTGPTVTQFEIEPAPGVKVRQIAVLSDDLALAMRAQSIRIVAPIPGKGAVGVEVPNPTPEMVAFRELIESREFQNARAALPIALGKDLEGKPVVADLAKMPHLLIAGATGSGKSVCVNTIITSLMYRHTPQTLRFLMVDPKMVELSVYNDVPHLRHKVITDNRDAAAVLKWAVLEMNDRYELLAANGCRNLQDFNRRVREGAPLLTPREPDVVLEDRTYRRGELPYIVVIIDEMADLMMTVQGEVETPIAMLAQKARAIGIHLILATQRPSVNVITGLIKANFPSRIAFRVASQVDSRTIIDGAGAEALLGNGDMLFIPPGKSEPSRLQGAYLSSEETERLMGWYRDRRDGTSAEARALASALDAEPDILESVRARQAAEAGTPEDGGTPPDTGGRDKLFREAAELCIQNQSGSTSLLQRRLNIGYGRAARIIDQLVDAGVLDERGSSKGRDVRVGLDDLERICGAA